jgi:hypothetical protein
MGAGGRGAEHGCQDVGLDEHRDEGKWTFWFQIWFDRNLQLQMDSIRARRMESRAVKGLDLGGLVEKNGELQDVSA